MRETIPSGPMPQYNAPVSPLCGVFARFRTSATDKKISRYKELLIATWKNGAEGENRFLIYLFIFIEIKNIRNFYTNVRTNKPELLPEFWSVCLLFKVLRTLSLAASNRACYVGNKN